MYKKLVLMAKHVLCNNESEVEVVGDVLVQRKRGRPTIEKQPKYNKPRGTPRSMSVPIEKRPRGIY